MTRVECLQDRLGEQYARRQWLKTTVAYELSGSISCIPRDKVLCQRSDHLYVSELSEKDPLDVVHKQRYLSHSRTAEHLLGVLNTIADKKLRGD